MHMVDTVAFRVIFRAPLLLDACSMCFRASQSLSVSIYADEQRVAGFPSAGETSAALHIVKITLMDRFTMGLALAVTAHGFVHFSGLEWGWHVADVTLLAVSTIDVFTSNVLTTDRVLPSMRSFIRSFRMCRVARCAMTVRHPRILTISMLLSLLPLFFAFVFLWFLVYLFAVIFM